MWLFNRTIVADCGHKTLIRDKVTAFGRSTVTTLPVENGKTPYCHRCLEKMAIRCAWCGEPIFVGDPVTLYIPNKDTKLPDYAVHFEEGVVGCLSIHCADTGADRAGFWYPPGTVKKVASPIQLCMLSGEASVTKNVGDSNEAIALEQQAIKAQTDEQKP